MTQFDRLVPDNKFQVFIIGPIVARDTRPAWRRGLDTLAGRRREKYEEHIANIEAAARGALRALDFSDDQFEVAGPVTRGGNIVENVFAKIDDADFAIADISTLSPNVFYELAFINALGTPVVLLHLAGGAIPFYWRNESVVFLETYSPENIQRELVDIWRRYFDDREPAQIANNLMTRFYGAPLVDVSAASGVAVGFFENFAKPVLAEGQGALALAENNADHLIVIRPDRINDHDSDRALIGARLQGAENRTLRAPAHKRGQVTALVLNKVIVDFPTPLYAMFRAPRYVKLRNRLRDAENLSPAARQQANARMEARLIASYFRTLTFSLENESGLARRKFSVVPLKDFQERGVDAIRD